MCIKAAETKKVWFRPGFLGLKPEKPSLPENSRVLLMNKKQLSKTGQAINIVGAFVGIVAALVLMNVLKIDGALPSALFGAGGAVVGSLIAMPIAYLVSKNEQGRD